MEAIMLDSPEIAQEKERIFNDLKSKPRKEVESIWEAICALEDAEYEEVPEMYKPGIPWSWWVESVYCVKTLYEKGII